MNYKISVVLILIALVASVLLSGCIEDGKLDKIFINESYPVLDYTIDLSNNNVDVIYIQNQTFVSTNFHLNAGLRDDLGYYREGVVILDNESYLKKYYRIDGNWETQSTWYELHIKQSGYPKGIIKNN